MDQVPAVFPPASPALPDKPTEAGLTLAFWMRIIDGDEHAVAAFMDGKLAAGADESEILVSRMSENGWHIIGLEAPFEHETARLYDIAASLVRRFRFSVMGTFHRPGADAGPLETALEETARSCDRYGRRLAIQDTALSLRMLEIRQGTLRDMIAVLSGRDDDFSAGLAAAYRQQLEYMDLHRTELAVNLDTILPLANHLAILDTMPMPGRPGALVGHHATSLPSYMPRTLVPASDSTETTGVTSPQTQDREKPSRETTSAEPKLVPYGAASGDADDEEDEYHDRLTGLTFIRKNGRWRVRDPENARLSWPAAPISLVAKGEVSADRQGTAKADAVAVFPHIRTSMTLASLFKATGKASWNGGKAELVSLHYTSHFDGRVLYLSSSGADLVVAHTGHAVYQDQSTGALPLTLTGRPAAAEPLLAASYKERKWQFNETARHWHASGHPKHPVTSSHALILDSKTGDALKFKNSDLITVPHDARIIVHDPGFDGLVYELFLRNGIIPHGAFRARRESNGDISIADPENQTLLVSHRRTVAATAA